MDVVTPLAAQLVALLAPFLPQLTSAGQHVAQGIADELHSNDWELARELWAKLRPKTESKPSLQEAVQDTASQPEDDDARAALRVQLRKLLTDEPALAAELGQILERRGHGAGVTASGERSVAVGQDVKSSTIITGDSNRVG